MASLSARKLRLPVIFALIALAVAVLHAEQAVGASAQSAPALVVQGLGKATVTLGGPWQFHLGDDARWAQPGIDDATGSNGWETISAETPWGAQAHYAYTGYAWYRRHIDFMPVAGATPNLALLVFPTDGPYEVYWNGRLIGQFGSMPPDPQWGFRTPPYSFGLGKATSGVLAFRMWTAPLHFTDGGKGGGLGPAPLAGSGDAIAAYLGRLDHEWLRDRQFYFDVNLLYALLGLLGFMAWLRNRTQKLLLWVSLFALMQPLHLILFNAHIPFHVQFATGFNLVVEGLQDVSLWFILLYLLDLNQSASLRRWTRILAVASITGGLLDWLVTSQDWSGAHAHLYQIADGLLSYPVSLADAYPVVLLLFALRKRLSLASWLVAITASVYELIGVVAVTALQGLRFTHWGTVYNVMRHHFFTWNGNYFDAADIFSALLLISFIYAVDQYSVDQSKRQGVLEQEFKNARELQHVLIPEELPTVPGFTLTSAYRPAREVGGDFFQIIPLENASTLVVLGDVSGKGLRAAMAVSMIVGILRVVAELASSPNEILAGLNRRLYGRLQGGFATCVVLRLDREGHCAMASAGHPAPWLNGRETVLPGALPLGISPEASYTEIEFLVAPGDYLAVYTDGLLEARNAGGEIYGIERLGSLFERKPGAGEAAETAVRFGQDDDITVLTLTHLKTAQESAL